MTARCRLPSPITRPTRATPEAPTTAPTAAAAAPPVSEEGSEERGRLGDQRLLKSTFIHHVYHKLPLLECCFGSLLLSCCCCCYSCFIDLLKCFFQLIIVVSHLIIPPPPPFPFQIFLKSNKSLWDANNAWCFKMVIWLISMSANREEKLKRRCLQKVENCWIKREGENEQQCPRTNAWEPCQAFSCVCCCVCCMLSHLRDVSKRISQRDLFLCLDLALYRLSFAFDN